MYLKFCAKKKKHVKKIDQFLGTNISKNAEAIFFKFDMWSGVYVRQNIYKFCRNWLSSF